MPKRPASPCSASGCPNLKPCAVHPPRRAWQQNAGRSAASRGYGAEWRRLTAVVKAEEPWCRLHLDRGQLVPTTDVDHITPKARGGSDARTNLRGLCHPCHLRVTGQMTGRSDFLGDTGTGTALPPSLTRSRKT